MDMHTTVKTLSLKGKLRNTLVSFTGVLSCVRNTEVFSFSHHGSK
jgi:hypothetical protein